MQLSWDLAISFSNVLMGENASYFENFDSMEKLWLAFIMLEKHKKKWKDGEWVLIDMPRISPRRLGRPHLEKEVEFRKIPCSILLVKEEPEKVRRLR